MTALANRYARFDYDADRNLGTDELGLRRFTRASERLTVDTRDESDRSPA